MCNIKFPLLPLCAFLWISALMAADETEKKKSAATGTEQAVAKAPEPASAQPEVPDYKIAPLDTLDIRVFLDKDVTGEYKVAASGSVSLPLVKKVKVAGLTSSQVEEELEKSLGVYLVDPQVTVTVKSYRKRTVSVFGEVRHPTTLEVPAEQKMDIVEALARAEGFTDKADKKNIQVTRNGKPIKLQLEKLLKNSSGEVFPLEPGDVVYVPQTFF